MSPSSEMIGLIGLGNAGSALAAGLTSAGRQVCGFDITAQRRASASRQGVHVADHPEDVVRSCRIILFCLPTPAASRSVMTELEHLDLTGRLIVETSTVGHEDIEWLAETASKHGASVVDAAIIGGITNLEQRRATFLVGASQESFDLAKPVLEQIAQKVWHLGPPGAGMKMKVINNAIAHTTMVMLLEGLSMAVKCGIEPRQYCELLGSEAGLTRPLTHRIAQRVLNKDYEGGMSTRNARKDSVLAQDLAATLGIPLFTISASHTVYEIADSMPELSQCDYASIANLWEKWGKLSFG